MKINNQIKEKMELVICTYIEDIILEFRNGQIARSEYDDLLLFCAEILRVPFLKMYDDYIERIVIDILNTITRWGIVEFTPDLYDGVLCFY